MIKLKLKKIALFLCILQGTLSSYAQETILLIGDQAPPIKYSKWVKGEPITKYKEDQLYVVEFWATWCGPCIAAMPHISELAHKYQGKISFVGVNVWEKIENIPYETVIPKVTKFVEGMGTKMDYNVAIDNNDLFMAKEWLGNAGVPGIPTTFLLQNGKVTWIGHPKDLESIIAQVQNGTYDIKTAREGHMQSQKMVSQQREAEKKLLKPIDDAIAAKEYENACKLMDEVVAKNPSYNYALGVKQFKTRLEFMNEDKAMSFAKNWVANDGARYSMYIAQTIADSKNLSKETYAQAAVWFEEPAYKNGANPLVIDYLAKCYFLAGNYPKAAAEQERALQAAKEALSKGKWNILENSIQDYQNTLKTYTDKLP